MRTGVSMLGNLETEQSFATTTRCCRPHYSQPFQQSFAIWYRFSHDGVRIEENTDDDSIGAQSYTYCVVKNQMNLHEQVMNVSLILYAEHDSTHRPSPHVYAHPLYPICIHASPVRLAHYVVHYMVEQTKQRWKND